MSVHTYRRIDVVDHAGLHVQAIQYQPADPVVLAETVAWLTGLSVDFTFHPDDGRPVLQQNGKPFEPGSWIAWWAARDRVMALTDPNFRDCYARLEAQR